MDAAGPPDGCPRSLSQFPLWIIEHVWTHHRMEALSEVDASCWPAVELQPAPLDEPWRWRVASACVFAIVRSRDVPRFERAVDFLDAAHRRLPGLVPAIKHMKVQFGLKTMVVMRMLRDGRGAVDVVSKISRFFPNRLPQYQHQCSRRELLLMRKNQQDFRRLAEALALDRNRLRLYAEHQMEQQYGERYAQKVEDRLLQYLNRLQEALPGDTHIDRLLKKQSPVTEEEELLLAVVASDCATVTAAVRKLLQRDAPSCAAAGAAPPPDRGGETPCERRPGGSHGEEEEEEEEGEEGGGTRRPCASSSPQFCCRHQRWVSSILQECPEDAGRLAASGSPPLFQSSGSTSSSQDLTPSDLVPRPPSGTETRPRDQPSGDDVGRAAVPADPTRRRREASPGGFRRGRRAAAGRPPASPRASASRDSRTPPQVSPQLLSGLDSLQDHRYPPGGGPCLSQDLRQPEASPLVSTRWTAAGGRTDRRTDPRPPPSPSTDRPPPARMVPVVLLVDIVSRRRFKTDPSSPTVGAPASPRASGDREAPPLRPPPHRKCPAEPLSSRPLQPYVRLTRLRAADCPPIRAAAEPAADDSGSSFDLNELYSDSSGGEEAPGADPDYRPCIKRRRLIQEYESARMPRPQPEALPPTGDTPPTTGDAPPPTGDAPPPTRDAPPPTRDTLPTTGDAPPPTGDAPPPTGDAPPPTGDAPPPTGDAPPPTRDAPPPTRDAPPPTRDARPRVSFLSLSVGPEKMECFNWF